MTTVRDIVQNHLKSIGADGLFCEGCKCWAHELFPTWCDYEESCNCVPGRRTIATEDGYWHRKGDVILVPMEQEAGR